MSRVLSGIQPTGNLHLGNYLGAIRNWVTLQDQHECFLFLADLHAITVWQDPHALRQNIRLTAATYIACGIDPKKSVIFPQSAVSAHAELGWILNCHTPLGWLDRMTQFKEKARIDDTNEMEVNRLFKECQALIKNRLYTRSLLKDAKSPLSAIVLNEENENDLTELDRLMKAIKANRADILDNKSRILGKANLGLYGYPVLMAADILIYKATHVPVGEDQKQHLELARDIAGAFNRAYGQKVLTIPEPMITGPATRVMSLRDGTRKMSKSDESDYSRINLTDDADTIALKFRKAKTDMVEGGLTYDVVARPEAANLINIYAALSGVTREQVVAEFAGSSFSDFKKKLTDLAVEQLAPITGLIRELARDDHALDAILKDGAERASAVAQKVMRDVKDTAGFLQI